jgi:hypothetical protein
VSSWQERRRERGLAHGVDVTSGVGGTWSATLDARSPERAWSVNFFYGDNGTAPITQQSAVRCVR